MTGVIAALVAHHVDVSHELKSRRRYRNDDLARAFVSIRRIRIRYRHHDREARAFGRRREPLVTVDDVIVAVLHGRRAHPRRVRSRMLGFGHRKTTAHVAARERREVFLFLLGRAMVQQDFHVADVGRLAVEQVVSDRCAAELFADERKLRERETEARRVLAASAAPRVPSRFNFFAFGVQSWRRDRETDAGGNRLRADRLGCAGIL